MMQDKGFDVEAMAHGVVPTTDDRKKAHDDQEVLKIMQTYVYHDYGENFFVSTCYRKSTTDHFDWFYETFAWKLQEAKELGEQVADVSGIKNEKLAIDRHFEVCRELYAKGFFLDV